MKNKESKLMVFRTSSGRYYAYDGMTSGIMSIGKQLVREDEEQTKQAVFQYLKEHHILPKGKETPIKWQYEFDEYLQVMDRQIPALLLQLTRRCNLRCEYCVYSGKYTHMTPHEENSMSWETIQKSIDFFALHNRDCETAEIDFYGGEAFLCLDTMMWAVAYAKQVINKKPLAFSVTSNGVLLRENALEWLLNNPEVKVTITINGPYHDQYRKTLAGAGSLQMILDNLEFIKERYPKVWESQILFLANISHPEQLEAMERFYEQKIGKAPRYISNIRSQDGNEEIVDMLTSDSVEEQDAIFRSRYSQEPTSFLEAYYGQGMQAIHNRRIFKNGEAGFIGSCLPGLEKLYVHWDGKFGICETACDKTILGDLDVGFHIDQLKKLYDGTEKMINQRCNNCWAQKLCSLCFKDILQPDGELTEAISESFCRPFKKYRLECLRTYCEIAERNPQRLQRYMENTNKKTREDE